MKNNLVMIMKFEAKKVGRETRDIIKREIGMLINVARSSDFVLRPVSKVSLENSMIFFP